MAPARLASLLSGILLLSGFSSVLGAEDPATIAKRASEILSAYHGSDPKPGERKLHVICWRPNDREYPADHEERLGRILEHIRDFFADEMERNGFGRRTIEFDRDEEGGIVLHYAVGSEPFADYVKSDGDRVRQDCWPVLREAGLDPERETVVIFTNLSDWDPEKNTFVHKSPYYANGNHRRGVAWQLASPELDTRNLTLTEPIIRDGEYGRISLGKHNSIFIGGIAHELGHGLGLPHCRARDDEAAAHGTALMGAGNRTYGDELRGEGKGSFLTLAHALRLASHPQFSGSIKGLNLPVRARFADLEVEETGGHFRIGGRVESPLPVYAVIAYLDPPGGSDYDARTIATVPAGDGSFSLECDALVPAREPAELRVVALLANGATATWRSPYRVPERGKVDVSMMQTTTGLADFVVAVREGKLEEAAKLAERVQPFDHPRAVADAILAARNPEREWLKPVGPGKAGATISLSSVEPAEVSVGWGRPAYDHLPGPEVLLVSSRAVHLAGIYAHAPARHVYELPDGHRWRSLSGACGLSQGRRGSVQFRLLVDGGEAFRTDTLQAGETRAFQVDVAGAKRLELLVEDGGDGNGSDWGFWFDPVLSSDPPR